MSHEVQAQQLFSAIRQLIEESKQQMAVVVNATMSMLYERTAISKKPELTIQQDLERLQNEQKLPSEQVLKEKLHRAIEIAKQRSERI